jgi:predicted amidophosphoribosyltransferase
MSIYRIVDVATAALEALAPRRCAGCGLPAPGDVCEACVELSLSLAAPASRALPFGACHAALPFEPPVRAIVHHAKYRGRRGAAAVLGALVVERLWPVLTRGPTHQPPPGLLVVPVPLGRRRRRGRGYNQAALLAAALAGQAGAPLAASGHAVRLRDTAPQVGRRGEERRANVHGAFAWRGPPLHRASVWLVDDVVTTGATLAALATALQQAGASRIEGVAAAMVGARHA